MGSVETFNTWASRISSEGELPDEFRLPFRALRLAADVFPLVLFSPLFKCDGFENPPKLLVIADDQIICLERLRNAVVKVELRADEVHSVEWGTVLLDSWIRFLGQRERGPASIRVDFNTASRDLFLPVLEEYRRKHYEGSEDACDHDPAPFDGLNRIDFKFMNYARQTLRPGVEVRHHCLQGAVSNKILGVFETLKIPASMLIATQKELIVIREGDGEVVGRYGGIWDYVLLDRIRRIRIQRPAARDVLQLEIQLPGDSSLACEYLPEKEREIRDFVDAVRKAQPGIGG